MRAKTLSALGFATVLAGLVAAGAFEELGLDRPQSVTLAILLLGALLWITEAVPLFVTSFLILLLCLVWLTPTLAANGKAVAASRFTAPFFSDVILLFLGGFVLAAAMAKFHLDRDLARRMIARTGRSVPRFMLGIMVVTAFLSMWLSNTAATAMVLALVLPAVKAMPAGDPARKAVVLAIPLAANVGGLGTPIGSPPNAIAMQYLRAAPGAPNFAEWLLLGVPPVALMLVLIYGLLRLQYRVGAAEIPPDARDEGARRYGPPDWLVVGIALLTVLGWLTTEVHPFSTGTVALVPVVLYFGLGLLTTGDLRALPWDVLVLMGGGLCLAQAVMASGLDGWIVGHVPTEGLAVAVLAAAFAVVACGMSTLMSNTATANLVMPLIAGLSVTPLAPVYLAVAFACSMAMALPVSTPPNAMAFGSGEIDVGSLVRSGLPTTVVGLVLTVTLFYAWWRVLGLA